MVDFFLPLLLIHFRVVFTLQYKVPWGDCLLWFGVMQIKLNEIKWFCLPLVLLSSSSFEATAHHAEICQGFGSHLIVAEILFYASQIVVFLIFFIDSQEMGAKFVFLWQASNYGKVEGLEWKWVKKQLVSKDKAWRTIDSKHHFKKKKMIRNSHCSVMRGSSRPLHSST